MKYFEGLLVIGLIVFVCGIALAVCGFALLYMAAGRVD